MLLIQLALLTAHKSCQFIDIHLFILQFFIVTVLCDDDTSFVFIIK